MDLWATWQIRRDSGALPFLRHKFKSRSASSESGYNGYLIWGPGKDVSVSGLHFSGLSSCMCTASFMHEETNLPGTF